MKIPYKRLPGWGRICDGIAASVNTVWLGQDHVLSVLNNGYTEEYKRFYFRDIQAFIVHKNNWQMVQGLALGLIFLAFAGVTLAGIIQKWPTAGVWIPGGIAGLFALVFIVNLAKGPTCAAYLQTAVQTERIHALCRWRTAMRTIGLIYDAVTSAQGAVNPVVFELPAVSTQIIIPVKKSPVDVRADKPLQSTRWHAIMAAGLLADAAGTFLQISFPFKWLTMLGNVLFLALVCATVGAWICQRHTDAPRILKRLTWLSFTFCMGEYCASSSIATILAMQDKTPKTPFLMSAWQLAGTFPFFTWLLFCFMLISAALGVSVWLVLARYHRERKAAATGKPADAATAGITTPLPISPATHHPAPPTGEKPPGPPSLSH
jgi:hypothetical protein